MPLYVETNFVLELAYGQEEHAAADDLLAIVEAGVASLHLPAFAVAEALSTTGRRVVDRQALLKTVSRERSLYRRSVGRQPVVNGLDVVAGQLSRVSVDERNQLNTVISRVLRVGSAVQLDADVDAEASRFRSELALSPPDAMILASVVVDLRRHAVGTGGHLFLSRDDAAFANPSARAELTRFGCRHVAGFVGGLQRVRAALQLSRSP